MRKEKETLENIYYKYQKDELKQMVKKFYEMFSLIVGVSAVLTLTFFMIKSPYRCIIPFEPNPFIRIPEIIIGLVVLPYYFKKLIILK